MTFTWPLALLLLLAVPLLLGVYLLQLRRRRRQAVRYSSVALLRAALPKRSAWRRHVPVALFLGGLAGLGVAAARPQMAISVPLSRTSIILTLDVSRSMCATDVPPNRLAVAQDAARKFVSERADGTRIGLVVFAGFAELVVPPTTDRSALLKAIDNLTTARGTVIGAATLKALDAIAAVNPDVAAVNTAPAGSGAAPATPVTPAVPAGSYVPDIVVLLTDGANTRGVDPVEAAQQAVDRHVRVYTIGFGTTNPTAMVCTRQQLGGDAIGGDGFAGTPFGGGTGGAGGAGGGGAGGGGPARNFLVIDEPTLTKVAEMTGGKFYRAEDADQLRDVFASLPNQVVLQKKDREVSVAFAAIGIALAGTAMALSLLWNRYP